MKSEIAAKFSAIKVFLFDLEGVLLKNNLLGDQCFRAIKNASDEFQKLGVRFGIITARKTDDVINKLKTIDGLKVISSSLDKVSAAEKFLDSISLDYGNAFYIGDDLLDIPLLKKCRVSAAPSSCRREVKREVTFVSKSESCADLLNEIITYYMKSRETAKRATKIG